MENESRSSRLSHRENLLDIVLERIYCCRMETKEKRAQCSERIYKTGNSLHRYRCDFLAVDGSDKCKIHHPDAVKRRDERSKLARAAKERIEDIYRLRFAAVILRRRGEETLALQVDAVAEAWRLES